MAFAAAPHLFAHCDEAVCVAEDAAVSFFAPKTLKKFRVERFNGARVSGLAVRRSHNGAMMLHVVDAEANYFIVALSNMSVVHSSTIAMVGVTEDAAIQPRGESSKPFIASRKALHSSQDPLVVEEAHFHVAGEQLHCVMLSSTGVYECALEDTSSSAHAVEILRFAQPLVGCTMAVGHRTGLVVVGQAEQRWLQYSTYSIADGRLRSSVTAPQRLLPINMQSVACSPVDESVAVGGTRGELVIYPSVQEAHFFSDHWHHTPLTAIAFAVDGSALFTGARESVILLWNLSSYTHRKLRCNLGPIRCIQPSVGKGSTLLLACGYSTLACADLLEMRLQQSVEGIEWASKESCRGLLVEQWMGQPAVILTGLPHVLRVCDPITQQSLYSLHMSAQMETITVPPKHGVQHAGLLQDGRVMVTYESFAPSSLPDLLRFWAYDATRRHHVEAQIVYHPHQSEILALQADKTHGRIFTLSRESMKCWESVVEDANDALATSARNWRNQSSSSTPSLLVESMSLSADGSLCFVADDSIHIFNVMDCRPGIPWTCLRTLSQTFSTAVLHDIVISTTHKMVAARHHERLFLWDLSSTQTTSPTVYTPSSPITAMCSFSADALLLATENRSLTAVGYNGKEVGSASEASSRALLHVSTLQEGSGRLAVVDAASGFRLLTFSPQQKTSQEERFVGETDLRGAGKESDARIKDFFAELGPNDADGDNADDEEGDAASRRARQLARALEAHQWLGEVLCEPSYTVPPMSSVLSLYLKRRSA